MVVDLNGKATNFQLIREYQNYSIFFEILRWSKSQKPAREADPERGIPKQCLNIELTIDRLNLQKNGPHTRVPGGM
jgi:hypothetical protein